MLGAIGAQLGERPAALERLRDSLNPVSRFDFGMLSGLAHAADWQAKHRDLVERTPSDQSCGVQR